MCGFLSLGDFGDCFNPISDGNLAYQAADTVGDAVGIDLPGVVANPVSVDIAAGAVCLFTGPGGCIPAVAVAFGHSTTMTVAEGVVTDWCDPGHLLAQEAVSALLAWGATWDPAIRFLAPGMPTYVERMLRSGNAGLQALLDYAQATP